MLVRAKGMPMRSVMVSGARLGFGDLLMTIPALRALAEYTGEPVDLVDVGWNHPGARPLMAAQPWINEVHAGHIDLSCYDYVLAGWLYPSERNAALRGVSESRVATIGRREFRTLNQTEYGTKAVRELGYLGVTPPMMLDEYPDANPIAGQVSDYVVVGTGWAAYIPKGYPYWEQACRVLQERGVRMVFVGGRKDSQPWMEQVGMDMCGQTTLTETASIMRDARLYLGVEGGLGFLSVATATPRAILFGPTDERQAQPWDHRGSRIIRGRCMTGEPCIRSPQGEWRCGMGHEGYRPCMEAIKPEYVAGVALQMLDAPAWEHASNKALFLSRKQVMVNSGAEPIQNYDEVRELIGLLRQHMVQNIVEIGTANGGWLGLIGLALGRPLNLLAIDPWDPDRDAFPREHPDCSDTFGRVRNELERNGCDLEHVRLPAENPGAVALTDLWVGKHGSVDVLHIDGDHSLEGSMRDYENYRRFVRPGGIIVFHDAWDKPGVRAVWEAATTPDRCSQAWMFLGQPGQHDRHGIGVVRLPLKKC